MQSERKTRLLKQKRRFLPRFQNIQLEKEGESNEMFSPSINAQNTKQDIRRKPWKRKNANGKRFSGEITFSRLYAFPAPFLLL